MIGSDSWETDVDPADTLRSAFAPQAANFAVWKATGSLLEDIREMRRKGEQAIADLKTMAGESGATISHSRHGKYRFYFENEPPEGWERASLSDSMPIFSPPAEICSQLQKLNEEIDNLKNNRGVRLLINDRLDQLVEKEPDRDKKFLLRSVMQGPLLKTVEEIDGNIYLTVNNAALTIPDCERVRLSDYYARKEVVWANQVANTVVTAQPS